MRNLLIISIALVSSTAFADEASPITTTAAARPSFTRMDPDGATNGVDLELGVTSIKNAQLVSQRLRGQVTAANGLGGYATLQGFLRTGENRDTSFGLANIELGGLYHARLGTNADASLHLGFTLPAADHDLMSLVGMFVQRPSDLVLGAPEDVWVRAGGSLGYHEGYVFVRLDAGIDQRGSGDGKKSDDQLLHLNAGVGVGNAAWSVVGELQVVDDPHSEGSFPKLVGVTAQYHASKVSPYLGASVVLEGPADLGSAYTIAGGARILF